MESAGIKSKYERKDDSEIKEVKGEFECPLCCVEYPYKETYALDCGHRHCMGCWKVCLMSACCRLILSTDADSVSCCMVAGLVRGHHGGQGPGLGLHQVHGACLFLIRMLLP